MKNTTGASAYAALEELMDNETMTKLLIMLIAEGAEKTFNRCQFEARMPKVAGLIKEALIWKEQQIKIQEKIQSN